MALAALFPPISVMADKIHVVRKGETLTGLSRLYDVPLKELAKENDLTTSSKIKIGEKLVIPGKNSAPQIAWSLKRQLDRIPVRSRRWKNIVIHHSATPNGTLKGMDRYHREERHMQNGLAYHFVVGNGKGMKDGEIAAGERWTGQIAGGHLASESLNQVSLGICLVGNFEQAEPTSRQLESLAGLINYLISRCGLSRNAVKTHQQINTVFTRCPGRKFPVKKLMEMVS
ncbi:MAG TPA: hypothetical protein DCY13_12000 [Verrucomicrobiales bacterium]|nr:hypothetical protein [Verrucomicrobiales bacterium]